MLPCAGAWAKGQEGQEGQEQPASAGSSPLSATDRSSPGNGARPSSAPVRRRHSHQPSFTVSLDQPIIMMDNYVDMGDVGQEEEVEEEVCGSTPGASRLTSEAGQRPNLSQSGALPSSR
jgi:hypothetical protein